MGLSEMDVKIVYCAPCGYIGIAENLKKEIQKNFKKAKVELVKGSHGIFDVFVDKKLIFSKYEEGRFPEKVEIIEKVKS